MPIMMLESYRLARNLGNLKHAQNLIQQQILDLTGEHENPIEALATSAKVPESKKLRIMRELAKLYAARGQPTAGIGFLTDSIVSYSSHAQQTSGMLGGGGAGNGKVSGPLGSGYELAARSLLVMVKWMQGDSRVMQTVWSSEFASSPGISILLKTELDYRKMGGGLYEAVASSVSNNNNNESYNLFQPDESVARFEKHEYSLGQLLHLTTMYCPELAKAWWSLAGWCYRIGRKNLEALR